MTWKAMTPTEVCDLMDFWAAAPWPLTRDEVLRLAVDRFAWTIEEEDGTSYLMNTVSNFTVPDVSTIGARTQLNYLSLDLADEATEEDPTSQDILRDAFAHIVREGTTRWGEPAQRQKDGTRFASWERSGGRVTISASDVTLSGMFQTPRGVEIDRDSGS
ncbi:MULTISPECIES: DUF6301 family protein [unclassified Microbacterium]|uniref:DUF6301 family protein n=1 Tax=unclassified Microbacterium TaxID=2609290 RepID=UPI003440CEC2